MTAKIEIFDSTLRDGAQSEGISFSADDKIKILKSLDNFGVDYIEAGNPSSNPKDIEFFRNAAGIRLKKSRLTAFGSTRRKNIRAEEDENVTSLLKAGTKYIAVFGKSWDLHVDCILNTTREENLAMIYDTVKFLTKHGKNVIFDAEHFFDGWKANPGYALDTLKAAERAGASVLNLCDTNGGSFPDEIYAAVKAVKKNAHVKIGIHCHNDNGCAVAGTIEAVKAGASHVQGTFTGFGERCGNANLSTVIANLQLKLGYSCVPAGNIKNLTQTARYISEIANVKLPNGMPYVGSSAFAHKGGMHADGVAKNPLTFEHIPPETVGNIRHFPLSEVSGRSAVLPQILEFRPELDKNSPETKRIIEKVKELENNGYRFEAASASFKIMVMKELGLFKPFFEVVHYKIFSSLEHTSAKPDRANAVVKVRVGDKYEITADEGDGPVNAIDKALRKALEVFYPVLKKMWLSDFKVRVVSTGDSTAAVTRVLIESTDGKDTWTTVGASRDIIHASMTALTDSLEYILLKTEQNV